MDQISIDLDILKAPEIGVLARKLETSPAEALGYVVLAFMYFREHGNLELCLERRLSFEDISHELGWPKDPDKFVEALFLAGIVSATETGFMQFVLCRNQDPPETELVQTIVENSPLDDVEPPIESKPIKKGLRFEILKRDGFRCVYCGATPLQRLLHVDHVTPRSKGGSNDPSNLVTACLVCNLGKSATPLDTSKIAGPDGATQTREHAEQIKEYLKAHQELTAAKRSAVDQLALLWAQSFDGWVLTERAKQSIKLFLEWFPFDDVAWAIERTAATGRFSSSATMNSEGFKYFCAIMHRSHKAGRVDRAPKGGQS